MTLDLRVLAGPGPSPGREAVNAKVTPQFDLSATYRGSSSFFAVYYDNSFGDSTGGSLADDVLARCDADYRQVLGYFRGIAVPLPITCVIYTGQGGYHHSCIDNVLYVTGNTLAPPNSGCDNGPRGLGRRRGGGFPGSPRYWLGLRGY